MEMSSTHSNPWFAHLWNCQDDEDDQILLQEFVGDCLVDVPENMTALLNGSELHNTLSPGSECNSSTVLTSASDTSNAEERDTQTTKVTKRPRRLPNQSQHHIIAERQRRQTLSQLFIALSALIPGLKKIDKTSVLSEAITHMKDLKERIKTLEDVHSRKAVESMTVIQSSRLINSTDSQDSLSSGLTQENEQLPEIEVRFSNISVMIKIHCQMQRGVLAMIMNQIENLNLSIVNTSSVSFNDTTLDITIMGQMEANFDMKPEEVVGNLRSIF